MIVVRISFRIGLVLAMLGLLLGLGLRFSLRSTLPKIPTLNPNPSPPCCIVEKSR